VAFSRLWRKAYKKIIYMYIIQRYRKAKKKSRDVHN